MNDQRNGVDNHQSISKKNFTSIYTVLDTTAATIIADGDTDNASLSESGMMATSNVGTSTRAIGTNMTLQIPELDAPSATANSR
ncbi:hypothetical protein PM082_018479 [Marasmius tenuissimus]|nr:hypothetical protein PM082_018479 [Marasmius tenuissimus]